MKNQPTIADIIKYFSKVADQLKQGSQVKVQGSTVFLHIVQGASNARITWVDKKHFAVAVFNSEIYESAWRNFDCQYAAVGFAKEFLTLENGEGS